MTKKSFKAKNGRHYDIAFAKSATRGKGDALRDAAGHLPLLGSAFEDRKMLYYEYQIPLAGTAGVLDTHYFSANGVYDPDVTATGHQPVGFDQAMLFFEQYVVFRSTCTVTFFSNTAGTAIRCGVFLNPDATNPTLYQIMENGYMKSNVVAGTSSANSGAGFHILKKVTLNCDSVAYFNSAGRKQHMMRDTFQGTASANPTEQVYFGIFSFNMASAATYDVYCDVELSYDVRFWEPRKIAASILHQSLALTLEKQEEKKKVEETKQPPSDDIPEEFTVVPKGLMKTAGVPRILAGTKVNFRTLHQ